MNMLSPRYPRITSTNIYTNADICIQKQQEVAERKRFIC